MKRILTFALLAGTILVAVPVLADDMPPPPPGDEMGPPPDGPMGPRGPHHADMGRHFFERFDLNKDGKVTKAEMQQVEDKHFAEISGGATTISKQQFVDAELKRARERAEDMFKHMDKNNDGKLDKAEFGPPHGDDMFAHMDTNSDGAITPDEMKDMHRHGPHRGPKDQPENP